MKTLIKIIALTLAFVFAIGSIGACEVGNITMLQCVIQCVICAMIEFVILKSFDGGKEND